MAMVQIDIDMSPVLRLGHRLDAVGPAMQSELVDSLQQVMNTGLRKAVSTSRKDAGLLRRSLNVKVDAVPNGAVGRIGSPLVYAPVMELGRKPGGKMPPKGALIRSGWLRRHGIAEDREFLIRRAIARHGIKGDHNLENTVKGLEPEARRVFAGIGPRVVRRVIREAAG
jgi:hypothetical protein